MPDGSPSRAAEEPALVGDPEDLFGPDGLGPISTIREITRPYDSYTASNRLLGGYLQLETPIAPWLKFLGLMRFEVFRQRGHFQQPLRRRRPKSPEEHRPQTSIRCRRQLLVRDQPEDVRQSRLRHDRDSPGHPRARSVSLRRTSFEAGTFEATRTCSAPRCRTPRHDTSTTSAIPTWLPRPRFTST